MELHHVAVAVIHARHLIEERAPVLVGLVLAHRLVLSGLLKDRSDLLHRVVGPCKVRDSVVADGGSRDFLKEFKPVFQRV